MALRESLIPRPSKKRIEYLTERIRYIESRLDQDDVHELIAQFAAETHKDGYDYAYFRHFNSFQSAEEFAREAATAKPVKVADITREELEWIVDEIGKGEEDTTYYLELLEANVPDPDVSDLIYWPNERGFDSGLTTAAIVTVALNPEAYRRPPIPADQCDFSVTKDVADLG